MRALCLALVLLLLAGPAALADAPVVATVGEHPITLDDLQQALDRSPDRQPGDPVPPEARDEALQRLIGERLLYEEALRQGLDADDKVRKVMINLLLRTTIYSQISNSDFTDAELRAYFESHRDEFVVPEKRQIKRIYLSTTGRSAAEARRTLEELRRQILADPDLFATLAGQHSEDPYRRRGGDLGFVPPTGKPGVPDEVVQEAYALEEGEVSQVFPTEGGMNLVYVPTVRERIERTYEQMKGAVLRKVKNAALAERYDAYVAELRAAVSVVEASEDSASLSVPGYTLQARPLPAEIAFRLGRVDVSVERFDAAIARTAGGDRSAAAAEVLDEAVLYTEAARQGIQDDPKVQKVLINTLLRAEVYGGLSNSDFTDAELRAYFEAHRDEFVVPEKRQIRRIYLSTTGRSAAEARRTLEELRRQILAAPERLPALAEQHSEGPYKRRGGDLGFVSRDGKPGIPDEVVERAFALEEGEVSQVFPTEGGMNLIQVTAQREAVERTYEQMKGSVLRKVKHEALAARYEVYVAELRASAAVEVEVDRRALKRAELVYGSGAPLRPLEPGLE